MISSVQKWEIGSRALGDKVEDLPNDHHDQTRPPYPVLQVTQTLASLVSILPRR